MAFGVKSMVAAGALVAALASADAASAQAARTKAEPRASLNEAIRNGAPASTTSLKFNDKGRWSVNVDVDEPVVQRERKLRDVEAGAYFRVTPSVRVGGSVRLDDKLKPERVTPDDRGARVRLETKFQF